MVIKRMMGRRGPGIVSAEEAAGVYIACCFPFPLPCVTILTADGNDKVKECCFICAVVPTPLGLCQAWEREGSGSWFKEQGARPQGDHRKNIVRADYHYENNGMTAKRICTPHTVPGWLRYFSGGGAT